MLFLLLFSLVTAVSRSPALAWQQAYEVRVNKDLVVTGNVKVGSSCGGNCFEGHDCTTCVGARAWSENGAYATAVYDKMPCCDSCNLGTDNRHPTLGIWCESFPNGAVCPNNGCPASQPSLRVSIASLFTDRCVLEGQSFYVESVVARVGNLSNNQPSCGSNCNAASFYETFPAESRQDASWGGFYDACPNPVHPEVVCVPSACEPGAPSGYYIPPPIPRQPDFLSVVVGGTFVWEKAFRVSYSDPTDWSPLSDVEYRLVIESGGGVVYAAWLPAQCGPSCSRNVPLLANGEYHWWLQARGQGLTSDPSKAVRFFLATPAPDPNTCANLGGYCVFSPVGVEQCNEGDLPLATTSDCAYCCEPAYSAVGCEDPLSHDHSGTCGFVDACQHVIGASNDPGCPDGPVAPPSCGALGGEYCSQASGWCPVGYLSLGYSTVGGQLECPTCCDQADPCADPATHSHSGSCGSSDSCGHVFGVPSDCWSCGNGVCEGGESASGCADCQGDGYCEPNVEGCGTSPDCPCWMAGTTCSTSGPSGECVDRCSDPAFHNHSGSCGQADECGHPIGTAQECLPSCGAMGGDYCSQTNDWCPGGHGYLGQSYDCASCCQADPCASPYTHDHGGSCGSTDSCGHSFGSNEDCGCPGAPTQYDTCWDYVCDTEWSWVPEYCDTCEQQCTTEWSCWTNCEWDYCWDECVPYESCSNNCYSYECGGYWAPSDNNCRWEPYQCNPHQCGY